MKFPIWFWIVTGLVTLFYLFGATIFTVESLGTEDFLIKSFGQKNAAIILGRPWWAKLGYALSSYVGLGCCITILIGKPQASLLAVISIFGMFIQQYYWWTGMKIGSTLKGFDWIWPRQN